MYVCMNAYLQGSAYWARPSLPGNRYSQPGTWPGPLGQSPGKSCPGHRSYSASDRSGRRRYLTTMMMM